MPGDRLQHPAGYFHPASGPFFFVSPYSPILGRSPLQLIRPRITRIRIIVKPLAGFLPVPPCHHQPLQQRRRGKPPLLELVKHHLRNVISSVQPNKIQQSKRTHGIPAPQLHRIINIFNRPHTFLISPDRIQQIRHQQPVHNETSLIRSPHRNLAQLFRKLVSRLVNVVSSSNRPHHLHQFHQRHRIKKVQPHKSLRTLHGSQKLSHRNRRSIRSKDRLFLRHPINRRIHLLLLIHILDDGLNNNVAISQVRLVSSPLKPRPDRILLGRRNPTLLHRPLGKLSQRLLNPRKPLIQKPLLHFEHSHIKSRHSANLRNPRSHQPTTKNANFLNFHYASRSPSNRIFRAPHWRYKLGTNRRSYWHFIFPVCLAAQKSSI